MKISRRFRWAALSMLCAALTGTAVADPAVDDYNFAVWLYNNGRYDVAIGAYEACLSRGMRPTTERRGVPIRSAVCFGVCRRRA